ncbi:hypothetical protein PITCH_A590007 [uncultured Desulfobacterium sp.]|uniref:Membrane protein involved in aromatic hydrocarbon degradation n=1 Tax=uncultured Desulfobacterium sp. TaxID=201089 RepID=A0A445N113_9BACT|nr:hypothetical protein PITCH_A590007 [uncultured Desulfobacterium sp.]
MAEGAHTVLIKVFISIFLAYFIISYSNNVYGGGFDNTGLGLQGMCMGNALTAIVDDSSSVYYNPAGLTLIPKDSWSAELYSSITPSNFQFSDNGITDKSHELFIVPGIFLARRYDKSAFGLGLYIPYAGGGTAYDNFQHTDLDLESFAAWFALTPAFAYRLGEKVALGIGVSLYYGQIENENLYFPGATPCVLPMKSKYDGIAGYGGHIGLMYKPYSKVRFGLTARSQIPIKMDGWVKTAGVRKDSEVEMTFPSSFDFGLGYFPNQKITIGLSCSYRLWGHMDEIDFKTEHIQNSEKTYYNNSWLTGIGIDYKIDSKYALKGGFKYIEGATKEKGIHPSSNDLDFLASVIGIGCKITKSIELNIAFMYVYGFEESYGSKKYDEDQPSLIFGFRYISNHLLE